MHIRPAERKNCDTDARRTQRNCRETSSHAREHLGRALKSIFVHLFGCVGSLGSSVSVHRLYLWLVALAARWRVEPQFPSQGSNPRPLGPVGSSEGNRVVSFQVCSAACVCLSTATPRSWGAGARGLQRRGVQLTGAASSQAPGS